MPKDGASKHSTARSNTAHQSQLNTISKAVAGLREFVDARLALMQKVTTDTSDLEQIEGPTLVELGYAVQGQLKVAVQCVIINAIQKG